MRPSHQTALIDALRFALERHGDQTRKGKDGVPYVSHLLQVCGLALEYGRGDVALAQAALLHDVIEDTATSEDEVRERFGPRVAGIVASCTDLLEGDTPDDKGPWRERKERYIEHLHHAPREARLVSACDKLHNLANLVADLRADGPGFLEPFNAGPAEMVWYYRGVRSAFGDDLPGALLASFDVLADDLEALALPGAADEGERVP